MFKSIATWAILAAALVQAVPAPIDPVDVQLDARDFEIQDLDAAAIKAGLSVDIEALEARETEVEEREIEERAVRTLQGLANFEKVDSALAGTKEIGKYGGLFWQGIGAVNAGAGSRILGINPTSPKNAAIYGAVTKVIQGAPVLTAKFTESQTSSFSLDSLYFGCVGTVVALPTRCVVALAGYDSKNNLVTYQKLLFNPSGGLKTVSNMQYAKLNGKFKGLSYVRFASTYSGVNLLGSTLFDNIKYTITTV